MPNNCGRPPPPPDCSLYTPRDRPLPAILSVGYIFLFAFSLLFLLPFFHHSVPRLLLLPRNPTERQHIKTGGGSRRWRRREDLRNADIAFPRLSGPLPFGASVFFFFYIVECFVAYLVVVILTRTLYFSLLFLLVFLICVAKLKA